MLTYSYLCRQNRRIMKKLLSIILLALVALTGMAQTRVWNDIVMGYASVPVIKVTKVAFYDDRTEVFLHLDMPEHVVGRSIPIVSNPTLLADGNADPHDLDALARLLEKL